MEIFETAEDARAFARKHGGGHIYPLFEYADGDFSAEFIERSDGRREIKKFHLKPGAQKIYVGYHVTLFKNQPKPGQKIRLVK